NIVGHDFGSRDATHEFMNETELALQKPEEGNLAAIEMGQIDATAKNVAVAIFGVFYPIAPEDRDVGAGIEDREVDADLHGIDGGLVFGIQKTRVAHQ